jgi:hypothetical protein
MLINDLYTNKKPNLSEGMEDQVVFSGTGANGGKYEIIQSGPNDFMIHANGKHIDTYGSLQRAMSVLQNEVPGLTKGVAEGSRTPQDWEVKSAVWGLDKRGVHQEPQDVKSHFVRADRSSRAEKKAKREYEPGRQTWEIHPRGNKQQGVAEGYQLDEGAVETITALVKKIPGIGKYYQMAQQYKPQLIEILKTSKSGKEVKQKMEQLAAGQSATVAESGMMKQLGGLAVGGGSILSTMWMNAMGMIDGVLAHAAAGEVGGAVASGSILGLIPVTLMLFAAMLMFKGSKQSSDEKAQAFQAQRGQQGMAEGKADYNFDIEDLKSLERIRDLATLKAQALELISKPSAKPMKPEKVEWFRNALERMDSPLKIIKLMYDLLLSGEGKAVVGTKSSMNPNSYRQRFGEQEVAESDALLARIKSLALLR